MLPAAAAAVAAVRAPTLSSVAGPAASVKCPGHGRRRRAPRKEESKAVAASAAGPRLHRRLASVQPHARRAAHA
eukprot:scaffold1476_cov363-Prasinococcus_capsulatus_cf.AAC.2